VFKVTTQGALTTLVSFGSSYYGGGNAPTAVTHPNGASPYAGLAVGTDGHFYGTTVVGGSSSSGTVFRITTNGVFTSLISFNGYNGAAPSAELLLGRDGQFYGTTEWGGSDGNVGTVFKVTTNGVLTTLVSFDGANGANPVAGLVSGSDGHFYGTTSDGGSRGNGTVFKITTNGVLTTLVSFAGTDGANPKAALLFGEDGSLYGTTYRGGSSYASSADGGFGTVFKMTTNGVLTTLISFTGTNGANPKSGLVLGRDGNFYGTSSQDRSSNYGTVFRVTTNGVLTSLVTFTGDNGASPEAGLLLANDGYFYGTTSRGGPGGGGTIFRLALPAFTSVTKQPDGSMLLTGTGPANGSYRLSASADLSLPFASGTLLTSASFDSNGNFSYTDVGATAHASRFYELSVP
jgi:uncharacterized repeat protein (TIGR03803 family)